MSDGNRKRELEEALRELMQREGVRRDNLRAALSVDLIDLCRIRPDDSPTDIRQRVSWTLEHLTQRLDKRENQAIARYSFNITGLPEIERITTLGGRQKALRDSGGVAVRTSQDEITKTVLPRFADELLTDPPGPMPETAAQVEAATEPDEPEPKPTRKMVMWVGGGLAGAAALVVAIVLIVNLAGGEDGGLDGGPTQTPEPTASGEMLVFDALGGTPPIIRVFPGVTDSPQDKVHNGTFNDGEAMPAICKIKGRAVSSDPAAGDRPRTSYDWIRIKGSPGLTQYATAVYVKDPESLLMKLRNC